mgnify:FL=1
MEENSQRYIRPEERIYEVATNKEDLDWKGFLSQLIHQEGLDPWDIDLGVLTKRYVHAMQEMQRIDFNISGKFLTIAVYLLKTKADWLVTHDLRGMDEKIAEMEQNGGNMDEDLAMLDEVEEHLDHLENHQPTKKKREKYAIKARNPLARKRKVTIYDLFDVLEQTIEQSNKRRVNFFQLKGADAYDGPMYERKKKDLKTVIEELHQLIEEELGSKQAHVTFHHLARKKGVDHRKGVLEHFIPLLHLHHQSRIEVKQEEHFGDIFIHKVNKDKQ